MAKKKLKKTVERAERKPPIPIPDYRKPYPELARRARMGMRLTIHKRQLNTAENRYDLEEISGVISDMNVNFVQLNTGDGFRGTPWFAIHDWEIEEVDP